MKKEKTMPNTKNIQRLIAVLELSDSFSMHSEEWNKFEDDKRYLDGRDEPECGTPACLLGHCYAVLGYEACMVDFELFLGIPREAALKACQPCSKSAHYRAMPGDDDFISKERALQMLKHLQAEGEVKWEKENHGDKKDISHELCG